MAKNYEVGQEVYVKGVSLPRVQHPNGDIKPALTKQPVRAVVRVVNDPKENPGKNIGVELDAPNGENLRWYDANELDGEAPVGFGWWVTPGDLDQVK